MKCRTPGMWGGAGGGYRSRTPCKGDIEIEEAVTSVAPELQTSEPSSTIWNHRKMPASLTQFGFPNEISWIRL